MLSVTLPRKPVAPITKTRRSLKISVGKSFVVISSARSTKLARALRAVMFQNVDRRGVVCLSSEVKRCALIRKCVHISTAQGQLLDDGSVAAESCFGERRAATRITSIHVCALI